MTRPKGPPLWAVDLAKRASRGLTQLQRKLAPPSATVLELVSAVWRPYALWAVAELGIADHLEAGPQTTEALAAKTGTQPDALRRLLRPLAHDGIFALRGPDTFALTPLAEPLRAAHPMSVRQTIRQTMADWNRRTWGELLEVLRTGEPAFPRLHGGRDLWSWFAAEAPEKGAIFHDSMTELTRMTVPLLVAAYDFSPHGRILDVGGGHGTLVAGILQAYPSVRGGILDLPGALAGAPAALEAASLRDRVELIEGNLLDAIPGGWDAYLMKNILHGASDAVLARMLGTARAALSPAARLLVLEMLVPEDGAGVYPAFLDLQMLVGAGGRERSASEYAALFGAHGLRLESVVRTASPVAMLVVAPA
jgi:hypothetical protein